MMVDLPVPVSPMMASSSRPVSSIWPGPGRSGARRSRGGRVASAGLGLRERGRARRSRRSRGGAGGSPAVTSANSSSKRATTRGFGPRSGVGGEQRVPRVDEPGLERVLDGVRCPAGIATCSATTTCGLPAVNEPHDLWHRAAACRPRDSVSNSMPSTTMSEVVMGPAPGPGRRCGRRRRAVGVRRLAAHHRPGGVGRGRRGRTVGRWRGVGGDRLRLDRDLDDARTDLVRVRGQLRQRAADAVGQAAATVSATEVMRVARPGSRSASTMRCAGPVSPESTSRMEPAGTWPGRRPPAVDAGCALNARYP